MRFIPSMTRMLLILLAMRPVHAVPAGATGEEGATIRGKITLTHAGVREQGHHGDALFKNYMVGGERALGPTKHHSASLGLSEMACVYLEGDQLPNDRGELPAKNPVLDQKDLRFRPHVLAIVAGTTVDFPNRDNLFHNVFSYSKPREFDLGRYPKDDRRSVTFDVPGTVRVYCDIHSHMNATILVLPHRFFAVPDDRGNYSIPRVPPGRYSVVFWYDRDEVQRTPVTVGNDGVVEVDFTY